MPNANFSIYRYRGISRNGTARGGSREVEDLPAWVAELFDKGWRDLVVCSGSGPVPPPAIEPADVVARIERHADTGRWTWWAECEETTEFEIVEA